MNHGSLFSGIGGFDLAAEWMGWNNVFHCEIESFPKKILKYYWPNAISYDDITTTDFTVHRGKIDILTGGFPCQPFSLAGKRKGTADHRNLWPEMYRAVQQIQPRWVVAENVYGIVNWSNGLVFEQVQADLENAGYQVQTYLLPAAGVGAPHKRDRIWFVAYNEGKGRSKGKGSETDIQGREMAEFRQERNSLRIDIGTSDKTGSGTTPNPVSDGHQSGRHGEDRPEEGESQSEENQRQRIWNDCGGNGKQRTTPNSDHNGHDVSENRQSDNKGNDCNSSGQNTVEQSAGCCSKATGETTPNSDGLRGTQKHELQQPEVCEQPCTGGASPNATIQGRKERQQDNRRKDSEENRTGMDDRLERLSCERDVTNTGLLGQAKCKQQTARVTECGGWQNFPTQSPVCSGDDGLPTELDGITFPKLRNESIKGYGNAIVPQVAYQIFKAITLNI